MPKAASKSSSLYDVHPGVAMAQKWIAELKPKTGRSLEEWIALVRKEGPKDYQARWVWLKSQHKLGTNSAWWIAERADGKGGEEDSPEKYLATALQYVEEQHSGQEIAVAACLRAASRPRQISWPRRQGLPVQDDGSASIAIMSSLRSSPPPHAHRFWTVLYKL